MPKRRRPDSDIKPLPIPLSSGTCLTPHHEGAWALTKAQPKTPLQWDADDSAAAVADGEDANEATAQDPEGADDAGEQAVGDEAGGD